MRDLLETLLTENMAVIDEAKSATTRMSVFPRANNIIKVAMGMRRTGKTFFLYQTIHVLMDQGVSPKHILFINFEDDRLLPMDAKRMGELLDQFYVIYPENHDELCYFFLDEVQNITDWHLTVRRYFDSKKVKLFITGSSAKLLSTDIHSRLRGRSLPLEIWPYSFLEFLSAHNIVRPKKPFGQAAFDKMHQQLLRYLSIGGFPAVQFLSLGEWRETLQGYVELVILKDIVERYKIDNIAVLKYLTTTLLKNAGSIFSIHKFYNDIKSQGYKIGKGTLHLYLQYLEDAFLCFTVPVFSKSHRAIHNLPKKIYAVDPGLVRAVFFSNKELYGRLFENIVYLDLRRQQKKIYYYVTRDGYEVDFVTVDNDGQQECIQVYWDTSDPKTLEREKRALAQAEQELGIVGKIIRPQEYLRVCCE